MNVNRLVIILSSCLIMAGFLLLAGCGDGGGSSSTFKLTIEAANVPTGTMLGTIQGVITVPAGVDIRTSATGQVLDGQITPAGTAAAGSPQVIGSYNTFTRQLIFTVVSPATGFGNGDCAVITFEVTAGAAVTAADFTVISVQGKDYTTAATVSGGTVNLK